MNALQTKNPVARKSPGLAVIPFTSSHILSEGVIQVGIAVSVLQIIVSYKLEIKKSPRFSPGFSGGLNLPYYRTENFTESISRLSGPTIDSVNLPRCGFQRNISSKTPVRESFNTHSRPLPPG
jgi:hypothetical protein